MSSLNELVGKHLYELRNSKKLSQEKFANICNVDRSYISRIERGLISPSVSKLKSICKALDTDLATFFREIEQ